MNRRAPLSGTNLETSEFKIEDYLGNVYYISGGVLTRNSLVGDTK